MGALPPANLVAHPQLVRGAHFPEMECWEPSAISLETPMEGHLGDTGVDGRQLTENLYLKAALHLHQRCLAECIGGLVMLENQHYH